MPRGKNYVNQHKGMALKAASKEAVKELCFYGSACQRKDCIYRHDKSASSSSSNVKSSDPCMAYLSGFCSFTAKTCRKRHPTSDAEVEALLRKYSSIPCRFGGNCKTKGCLYMHLSDSDASNTAAISTNGMPLAYPLPNLPQPYGPLPLSDRRPNNMNGSSKAIRRTLMDPNAFPPLGADSSTAAERNPPVCLPATVLPTAPAPMDVPLATPQRPLPYSTYATHDPGTLGPPLGYSSHDYPGPMVPSPTVGPPALESSTSTASWNLQAQEFVPRGLI